MLGYFIYDAAIISCLVFLGLIFIQFMLTLGIKIYRYCKYKQYEKEYRLNTIERQIKSLQNNDDVHMNVANNHVARINQLEEQIKNKEDKKNVKKKKRN